MYCAICHKWPEVTYQVPELNIWLCVGCYWAIRQQFEALGFQKPIQPPAEPQWEEQECMVGGHSPGCQGHGRTSD